MTTIGIDLGTTNSLVAYWTEEGAKIIPNILGSNLTPSVVSVDENNEIIVGQVAKERLITHPQLTAFAFKRYMGTEKQFHLGKYSFSSEELSSFVLKSLKSDAEAFLGEEVTEAVISVPAYFNDAQRKATKKAAELAGLKVERLVSEPTAAAISYGLHQEESETKFIVFDLGGGTFDVSILELFEGVMEVKSIAGDNFLGGEDFTNILVSYFVECENIDVNSLDYKGKSALYKQAELCKRAITSNEKGIMSFRLNDENHEKIITPLEFDKLVVPLLVRLRRPIERALRDAELTPNDLDAVILIGGATRMPVIKSTVGKIFGKLPYSNINPDEAVALGAAIQVALKERNESLSEVILTDVCPYTLGTGVVKRIDRDNYESGYFLPIIERNTPIPVSRVERLSTVRDNQTVIQIDIYQGENRRVDGNIKLGELSVKVPPAKAGQEQIDIRYTYDINGILEVEVIVVSTGIKERIVIEKNPGSMSKENIEKRLKDLENIKIHPRDKMENRLLLARGERLYEESLGEKREFIGDLLQKFEAVLSRQDEREVKKAAQQLKETLEQLEGWFDY
ncbi:molecular chaperone HscC [Inconstantimicrobium mannanitabidum]|uniref:Molecular chaperone HscC n=1 Tax=Inconstantimicrobium mannanitabidum TaxID=1604901 RepID=A0ACB5RHL4_9CLOT|nr:molecular chaperone HscC [Clostridium sp. TW13]GKX68554.1 molecular chaperone HscC [Clostridium sp. TW13]